MAERRGEQLVVAVHGDAIELLISRHDTSQACLSNGGFERECEDLCELARANGMRTQRNVAHSAAWAGHNCNPTKEDAFDANKGLPEAAVAYAARMRGSGAAAGVVREGAPALGGGGSFFFANEGRLPAALAFGSFAFVAVIREPLRLAVSLYGARADAARLATYNNRQLSLFIGGARRPASVTMFERF